MAFPLHQISRVSRRLCSTFVSLGEGLQKMLQTRKAKNPNRGQRHSAAWGKRLGMLLLLVLGEAAFAQHADMARSTHSKFAPDLAAIAAGTRAGSQTVKVIVQYAAVPQTAQTTRLHSYGGQLGRNLG